VKDLLTAPSRRPEGNGGSMLGSPNHLVAIDSCDPAAAPQAHTMSSQIADSASGIAETVKEGSNK
jgi:hypothetical protein